MEIVGYSDRLSVAPGGEIRFMVSCAAATYCAELVRLIHGDETAGGPGFKERVVPSALAGDYPGRVQPIDAGSYVVVPDDPLLRLTGSLTIAAWIWPTLLGHGMQGIVTKWSATRGVGYGLVVDERGCLALWLGGPAGQRLFSTDRPLRERAWALAAASFDAATGEVALVQAPARDWPRDPSRVAVTRVAELDRIGQSEGPLLIAARELQDEDGRVRAGDHFNGKIDRPRLFARALTAARIATLAHEPDPPVDELDLIAAWDFTVDAASARVADRGPHGRHGIAINLPARAMTGHNWSGRQSHPALAPAEYGAIHFHEDDLEDAGWASDVALTVPADLPSGVYAARLRTGAAEDHLPFVVHPPVGTATAPALVLVPTNTYLAYANFNVPPQSPALFRRQDVTLHEAEHRYMTEQRLLSLYDRHRDGSGVCHSSSLRPILNFRPRFKFRDLNAAHNLPADLYLVDWLEAKGHAADFATDEDLHRDGLARLQPYRVVLTGTHPEYWTEPMLDALQAYLARGGRIMYLGGNGFYWVTSFHPDRPHAIEVRRWGGTEAWAAEPGEYHHGSTGELGGVWRNRGRAPQALLGVGFTAQGFDRSAPYARKPDSFDPRAAFIFEGIGEDELIGDVPALTLEYGAAGFELDRVDPLLGTPPHALTLASSFGHSDSYQHVIEEVLMSDSTQGGSTNPLVRSDLVYFEGPHGGAVFSVGSIAWCGALSANGYDNTVSRITDNVLRRFAAAEPLV